MFSYDFSICSNLIDKLKKITVEEISDDPLIRLKLNKIKLQATMPFCAEQVISILVEILSLKHDYNIYSLSKSLKFDKSANISILVESIFPLLDREQNTELSSKLAMTINAFKVEDEKVFFEEIKILHNKYISCIDIDFVMQASTHTRRSEETAATNAILVVGKTGAGKSFVINYICCEEMFNRSMFGKLTIHHHKQPKYLEHIKIGESVRSETSKMGVVDVYKSQSKWMSKFRGKKYVICDTPGAGDNRKLGPELKLANSLETIIPMYKADSVRFLVIISSQATSARGEEFRETIKFVSKMFDNPEHLNLAANSMVFAINGEDGEKYEHQFVEQLAGFYASRHSLELSRNDLALIEILQKKFELKEVCFIQPGKKGTVKPEELMSKLDACQPINPKILTPFAESNIKDLEQESNLLTQSIDKIFESLEEDISNEVMQIQVQRLGQKLAKLNFMDAYYSINQSNLLPYFAKLADLMRRLEGLILSTFCPENGAIKKENIKRAQEALECLCELDQMVSMMINGLFYDNRAHTASLIAAFDNNALPPSDFKTMAERHWFAWVATHRPKNAAKKIEDEIIEYRAMLSERLTRLVDIQLRQINVARVHSLQNAAQQIVPYASTVSLDRKHPEFCKYIAKILSDVIKEHFNFQLEEYTSEVAEYLEKEIRTYIPSNSKLELELSSIIQNLKIHDTPLDRLFFSNKKLSWSVHSNQASEQLFILIPWLIEYANRAYLNNDFAVVVNIIETIDNLVNGFGLEPFLEKMPDYQEKMTDLMDNFRKRFISFVSSTYQLISKKNYEPLDENEIQSLLLNLNIIAGVRNLKAFSNIEKSEMYQTGIVIELGVLEHHLRFCFFKIKQEIKSLCQEYTEENYLAIDKRLIQLWYLLSLPYDNHAELASEYAEVVKDVSEYSMKISGELTGQLQADTSLNHSLYEKIKVYLKQLKSLTMVAVLDLSQAEKNIKDALNKRALLLIDTTKKADLDLGCGNNIISDDHLIQEIKKLREEFSEDLPRSTVIEMREALEGYNEKISNTLKSIFSRVQNLTFDKNEEMPVEFFIQSNLYVNNCEQMAIFSKGMISTFQEHLKKATQKYEEVKKLLMAEMLESLKPTASTTDVNPGMIITLMAQFKELPNNLVSDSNLIQGWTHELNELVLQYQDALAEALQLATRGNSNNHEELLKRVAQFQVFDTYIKQSRNDDEKPLSFKKLLRRFENAFKAEHFSKLKDVMLAIFNGDFKRAQELATENKELALGTDMRLLLTDQIGICISASISTIERGIDQLRKTPIANPSYMPELMQSYERIKSAQSLVDAGLLSEKLLVKRNELLSETQDALDVWLSAVIVKIEGHIQKLDFKSAISQISDLQGVLKCMQVKLNNADHSLAQVKELFDDKVQQCLEQYQRPLINWHQNTDNLARVATAFAAVKDFSYYDESYGKYWEKISAQVYQTIDERCKSIEDQFNKGEISVEEAVNGLEQIASIVKGVPSEPTDLHVKVKERYQKTVVRIQKYNLENHTNEVRHKNIQSLIEASERLAKSMGQFDLETTYSYLFDTAKSLKESIIAKLDKAEVPEKELIYFANLYLRFSYKLNFLQNDHDLYANKLKKLVKNALNNIQEGSSLYVSGDNQTEALGQIHVALTQLIEVQNLSTTTNGMARLVDASMPYRVVERLLEVKQLLLTNGERFKAALASRDIAALDQTLVVAGAFQEVTLSIERYINAGSLLSPLPEEFQALKQLNNEFSYVGLRNMLIAKLKSIRSELEALNPAELEAEGIKLREKFYANLRRNIEFIQKMPELDKHLNQHFLKEKAVASDYGLDNSLKALSSFLEKIFILVQHQLKIVPQPSADHEWVEFNRYYQELHIFVAQCSSAACLSRLKIPKKTLLGDSTDLSEDIDSSLSSTDESIEASLLDQFAQQMFIMYFRRIVTTFKYNFHSSTEKALDQELVALLAGLQKMAEDMPFLTEVIKTELKKFLKDIQAMRPESYMSFLAVQLRVEERGFGARMVAEQTVFAGVMIAERNMLTQQQDIKYVLKRMEVQDKETGEIRSLSSIEYEQLLKQYLQFDEAYSELLNGYISKEKDFAKFNQLHLDTLKEQLCILINANKPDTNKEGSIIWNEKIAILVPKLYAYLFTIWTLKESPAFFDATNTDSNTNFLKKPHPAQMVAIFQMLNTIDAQSGLPNVLDELLTGQGKSVVLALTTSLLSLLGFAVHVGCYSEYLSERDKNAFKWLIDFLDISEFVQYGTFNGLTENMLNQKGDLRTLLSNALFDTKLPINPKVHHGRETIALVDEVDSLVTAFFGHMYQPYFLLTGKHVNDLLDAIWEKHELGCMNTLRALQILPEYRACLDHYKDREYIIKQAAREMYADLQKYKREQDHDFHVNSQGELYYKLFDGTTMSKSIGYCTYWACRDKTNNISRVCKEKHEGIKITVGAYSYVDLMCSSYRAILGVTGTYRELSEAENHVVKNVFGIEGASFIPSVYGENKLKFTPGDQFIVVDDDEYNVRLIEEINKRKLGWHNNGQPIRPVLIFFDTEEELEAFYNCEAFRDYKSLGVNKMTSQTITTTSERDTLISQATRANAITLATKEHGRGSDFMLTDPTVIANGGMAVMDAFMPETEAEQRQHKGRAGRQGQDGSFTMVIKKSEIFYKFGLSKKQIKKARNAGNLYEVVSAARNKKFSDGYQKLVDDSGELFEKFHQPSMKLLETLHDTKNSSTKEIIDTHMQTLPGGNAAKIEVELREAKVLILFDSTGSMSGLIDALKSTLAQVVETLGSVLGEANCTFQLQLAHYKDYDSGPKGALHYTNEWTCDPIQLKEFINSVNASGGGGNSSECVELGLFHANQLANDGLNHVILIGDEPPSPEQEMTELRDKYTSGFFAEARHYVKEAENLAEKQIPVSTFFARTSKFNSLKNETTGEYLTQEAFKVIADKTGGETGELHLQDPTTAVEEVTNLFAKKILGTVANGDTEFADELFERFTHRMQQHSK